MPLCLAAAHGRREVYVELELVFRQKLRARVDGGDRSGLTAASRGEGDHGTGRDRLRAAPPRR